MRPDTYDPYDSYKDDVKPNNRFYDSRQNEKSQQRGERKPWNMIVKPHFSYIRAYVQRDTMFSDGMDDHIVDGSDIMAHGFGEAPCWLCNITSPKPYFAGVNKNFIIIDCPICRVPFVVASAHSMSMQVSELRKMQAVSNAIFHGEFELVMISRVNHLNFHIIRREADRLSMIDKHTRAQNPFVTAMPADSSIITLSGLIVGGL
jgi:hypothetical protein